MKRDAELACAAAFAALGLLLLWPVLDGGFFADDWELWLAHPAQHLASAFGEVRPFGTYRPIQLALVAGSQALWPGTTVPVHVLNLALHVALCVGIARALAGFGAPLAGAVLGGTYAAVSQLAASAVGGNDTISLTLGTWAGFGALACLRPFEPERKARPALAALSFAVALFAKESSVGFLPLLAAAAWWRWGRGSRDLHRLVSCLGAFCAITAVYLAVRHRAGGAAPDLLNNRFVHLGPHMLGNAALLGFAAVVPVSTTRVYLGALAHRWLWPAAGALSAFAWLAFTVWGMRRAGRLALLGAFAAAALVLFVPVLPLVHVSELYAYGALPLAALAFGWSSGALLQRGSRAERAAALAFALFVLAANAWAAREDALGMAKSGREAAALMPQLVEELRALPPDGTAVLVDPPLDVPNYSVFQVSGFRGVLVSRQAARELSGRSDVDLVGLAPGEPRPEPCSGCVFFELASGNRIAPMP